MVEDKIQNKSGRYFHITPARNLLSIMQDGLWPCCGERSEAIGESEPKVFLFPKIEEADDALYNWLGEAFEDESDLLLILQFDLPKEFEERHITRERDDNGDLFYEAECDAVIPSEYLTEVYNELYIPLSKEETDEYRNGEEDERI
jgi:hypothetical protein